MDDLETQKIFAEQLKTLPQEVTIFLSTSSWNETLDEIGSLYNLSNEKILIFKREAVFVLIGLVHPNAFGAMLAEQIPDFTDEILGDIVASVEEKIFAPIRPALIEFFDKEAQKETKVVLPAPNVPRVSLDFAPDNLPVADESADSESAGFTSRTKTLGRELEAAPLNPPIPPKILNIARFEKKSPDANLGASLPSENGNTEPSHPFEEKMKRVFTAGTQSMGDLTIETPVPSSMVNGQTSNVPSSPPIYHADPYREVIE